MRVHPELEITPAQRAALAHVRAGAVAARDAARSRLAAVFAGERAAAEATSRLHEALHRARVGLNFHPDRLAADGRLVAEALRDDGLYRNQFESGISNGSLTARPGGDRNQWEARLFGEAYHVPPATPAERPKYGALDLLGFPDGPAPRFGSCHLRLRPGVLARATFCFGDSHLGPADLGTLDAPEAVLAGLAEALHATGSALGHTGTTASFLATLDPEPPAPGRGPAAAPGRALDEYVEVQVHGDVRLGADGEALVADPSFRDGPVGAALAEIGARYGLPLRWHRGFELAAAEVPEAFRGPRVAALAPRVADEFGRRGRRLDAAVLGHAARSVVTDPERWRDWGTPAETLQHLKQLWHVLVRFGEPASE